MAEMVDVELVFRRWLESLPRLEALVGKRISKTPLPSDKRLVPRWGCQQVPCVTYGQTDGDDGALDGLPISEVTITFICWAEKEDEALRVWRVIANVISEPGGAVQEGGGHKMHGFVSVGSKVSGQEEDSKYWMVSQDVQFETDMYSATGVS